MVIPPEIAARADAFAKSRQVALLRVMGGGHDGIVWHASRDFTPSAIKVHAAESSYLIEREAYIRLKERDAEIVAGFALPMMLDHDDEFLAIQMTIVNPPFLVDFASAIFDVPPDFIEDEGHTFADFIRFRFDDHADAVLELYYELASRTGIYLPDMHAQNVKFG